MTVAEHKQIVTRIFEDAFNRGDLGVIDALLAESAVDHQHPDEPSFTEHLKTVVTTLRTAFPDLHFEITEMIGEGEWVAVHCFMTGTNLGELRPPVLPAAGPPVVPPTGKSVRVAHMHLIRFEDGKHSELWHIMDTLTMLGQLGLLPAPTRVPVHA